MAVAERADRRGLPRLGSVEGVFDPAPDLLIEDRPVVLVEPQAGRPSDIDLGPLSVRLGCVDFPHAGSRQVELVVEVLLRRALRIEPDRARAGREPLLDFGVAGRDHHVERRLADPHIGEGARAVMQPENDVEPHVVSDELSIGEGGHVEADALLSRDDRHRRPPAILVALILEGRAVVRVGELIRGVRTEKQVIDGLADDRHGRRRDRAIEPADHRRADLEKELNERPGRAVRAVNRGAEVHDLAGARNQLQVLAERELNAVDLQADVREVGDLEAALVTGQLDEIDHARAVRRALDRGARRERLGSRDQGDRRGVLEALEIERGGIRSNSHRRLSGGASAKGRGAG